MLEHLTVIKNPDSDPNLYWDNNGRVLVATFTGEGKFDLSTKTKIWVTAVPQLKNFCTDYRTANPEVDNQKLNQRIEQLKCYSKGLVTDNYANDGIRVGFGGLIGADTKESCVLLSFWDKQTSNQADSAGGTGKTTAEMKNKTTLIQN